MLLLIIKIYFGFIRLQDHIGWIQQEGAGIAVVLVAETNVSCQRRGVHNRDLFHILRISAILVPNNHDRLLATVFSNSKHSNNCLISVVTQKESSSDTKSL